MTWPLLPCPWCPPDATAMVWVVVALAVLGVVLDRRPRKQGGQ
jgi:hypothetical protein